MILSILLCIMIGLAGGLAVGAGFVAFITVLGVIPRLMQLTKSMKMIFSYEAAVVLGVVAGTLIDMQNIIIPLPIWLLTIPGLFYGIFTGMLAAALYEVLNVFPILSKRIHLDDKLLYLIMALVFGKIFGSLFHWIFYVTL